MMTMSPAHCSTSERAETQPTTLSEGVTRYPGTQATRGMTGSNSHVEVVVNITGCSTIVHVT